MTTLQTTQMPLGNKIKFQDPKENKYKNLQRFKLSIPQTISISQMKKQFKSKQYHQILKRNKIIFFIEKTITRKQQATGRGQ